MENNKEKDVKAIASIAAVIKAICDIESKKEKENKVKGEDEYEEQLSFLIINPVKKYVFLKCRDKGEVKTVKVECQEEDKFNWKIGFGLALSKLNNEDEDFKKARECFRNKKGVLDYKAYSKWCIFEIYQYNKKLIDEMYEIVDNALKNSDKAVAFRKTPDNFEVIL